MLASATVSAAMSDDYVGVQHHVFSGADVIPNVDPDLAGILTDLAGSADRTLMVKIWYPAKRGGISQTPHHYGFHTEETDFALDPDAFEELLPILRKSLTESRSVMNASPAKTAPLPVIMYSHGSGGAVEANDVYFEHLVRRGYIVVSVGHTYDASLVTLDNGRIAYQSTELSDYVDQALPDEDQDPDLVFSDEKAVALSRVPIGVAPPQNLLSSYHYFLSEVLFGSRNNMELWVQDMQFVLSELEALNNGGVQSSLTGMFDLTRIGAVGYSFGGASARHFCDREMDCQVSINIDGTDYSRQDETIQNPHLRYMHDPEGFVAATLRDTPSAGLDPDALKAWVEQRFIDETHAVISRAESDLIVVTLDDSAHEDFTMEWLDLHDFGPGKAKWHAAVKDTSAAFLDAYLQQGVPVSQNRTVCARAAAHDVILLDYSNICD